MFYISLKACLVQKGQFIFNPSFWLILRIGMNNTIATLGNITLFLILDGLRRANVTHSIIELATPELMKVTHTRKSDETTAA
ncbi:uncharacterized protein MELLADRAFT_73728 [Melampsora larici-populina 98AG31]|uniref:Uncharacterized protein n=1 Tax=Melampsora larici-populina (strain 98AG31 / pathotype 3-4-7) TaxID=747676 RepID=F4RKN3_MELLP|nr:uncharacterized protein MELLADRAFT_56013 [Melampsora larici-populina 98AG31]XP_007419237.1 uncharacterized protein MELLADRAFT_73728 [Melampsora larici-populina 98AG31]EGF97493.1 hypothetical protein MELLADRAFT_73728 [Melampsora larici-populina 98AG31]EGG07148.1 hypothetical protein MELLADRAFT_56013 [Melampsora larici-populina 98AG31]